MLASLSSLLAAALLGSAQLGVLAQSALTINTPTTSVNVCANKRISWSGGAPPYIVRVYPGGQLDSDALADIAINTQDTSATWRCNVAAGTSITFAVQDDNGDSNASAQVTVADSLTGDTSCLNATSSLSASSSASASASTSSTSASARDESSQSSKSTESKSSEAATSAAAAETAAASASPSSSAIHSALVDVGVFTGSILLALASLA